MASVPAGRRQSSSRCRRHNERPTRRRGSPDGTAGTLLPQSVLFAQLWEVPTARLPEHGLRENVAEFFPRRRRCALRFVPGAAAQSGGHGWSTIRTATLYGAWSALPNPLSHSPRWGQSAESGLWEIRNSRRCDRRAQIEMPRIGQRLRCSSCNEVQVFGTRPRRRREIAGITRFSDRRAPAAKAKHASLLNDDISDLFVRAG